MDIFTEDILADDTARTLFPTANLVVSRLQDRLIAGLEMKPEQWAEQQTIVITQVFIRRSLAFLAAGVSEFKNGRSLLTSVCARANMENVAAYCDFVASAIPLCQAYEKEELVALTRKRAFAARISDLLALAPGKEMQAVNILTQVDKIERKDPGFRSRYDQLSEIVHPNGSGTIVQYLTLDGNKVTFHDDNQHQHWGMNSLILSAIDLVKMEESITELEIAVLRMALTDLGGNQLPPEPEG